MKKNLLKSTILALLFGFSFSAFGASTPAADDGKWYYVKSQRGSAGLWWTKSGATVVPNQLQKTDDQKFTLVSAPNGEGKVVFKRFDELKLTADGSAGTWNEAGAQTGWTQTSNIVGGLEGFLFPGENQGVHQGGSGWGWRVATSYYRADDACTFFFYEVTPAIDLHIKIDDTQVLLNGAVVGTNPGEYTQQAKDDLQAAINTAKEKLGETDEAAIQSAIEALDAAVTTFKASVIPLVDSSTANAPIWYLIKNVVRGGAGGTAYTDGFNALMKITTAANSIPADGSGTDAKAPALKYLYRFEKIGDKYRIVNAAHPNGEALQASAGGNSSQHIKYGTVTEPSTLWTLSTFGWDETLNTSKIRIASDNNTVWHAADWLGIVSWNSDGNSASAWYVEKYTGDLSALYQPQYDAHVALYNTIVDAEGNLVAPYVAGVNPGEYDVTKLQAVTDAYNAMVAEKEANGVQSNALFDHYATLVSAINAFKASKVAPVPYAGVIDVEKVYTLKLAQTGAAHDGYYLTNPRTGEQATNDDARPYATFSAELDETDNTTMWKFTPALTTEGSYILISQRGGYDELLDEEGRLRYYGAYKDGTDDKWFEKTLHQSTLEFSEDSKLIIKININNNYFITNDSETGDLRRSATDWSTFILEEYVPVTSDIEWIGDSYITIGGMEGTWYNGSKKYFEKDFDGANLGGFEETLELGGEIQAYMPTEEPLLMFYQINDGEVASIELPKVGTEGNNSKHYGTTSIDISELSTKVTHTVAVWFKAGANIDVWDSNNSQNYVATFTKFTTDITDASADAFKISVVNGKISVVGVDNFDVYSVAGQKMNKNSRLNTGIYIVKINNQAIKVQVK